MCFLTAPLTYPKRFHKDFAKKKAGMLSNTRKEKKFFFKTKSKLRKKINGDFLLTQGHLKSSSFFSNEGYSCVLHLLAFPWPSMMMIIIKKSKTKSADFAGLFFARAATTNTCSYTERKVTITILYF